MELDSHADMAVIGKDCHIISHLKKYIEVSGYDPSMPSTERELVSACFAYDDPDNGQVKILVIHQALYVPTMNYSLIPPAQMRDNDVIVNECPKSMMDNPTANDHALILSEDIDKVKYKIPLELRGTISCIPVRKPTEAELNDIDIRRYTLTAETPEWDPQADHHQAVEKALNYDSGKEKGDREYPTNETSKQRRSLGISDFSLQVSRTIGDRVSQGSAVLASISPIYHDDTLGMLLNEHRIVSAVLINSDKKKRSTLTPEQLAKNWQIPLEQARTTLRVTTQRGVRPRPNPLVRRFKTNDRHMRYDRLNCTMYTDTMFSDILSKRQNKCAQIYTVPPHWIRAYAMASKGDAHYTFQDLAHDVGVPDKLVMDNSKEQTLGAFRKKCRDAGVKVQTIEPYSQWQNDAEKGIGKAKKKTKLRMTKLKIPKRLWDDCLEWECDVMSHVAHATYGDATAVPHAQVVGRTPDISKWAEFGFYDWIYWWDCRADFPDDNRTIGRYLGPSRDVGGELCCKILKKNGQTVHRSTIIAVDALDMMKPEVKKEMEDFTASIEKALGESLTTGDLPEDDIPEYVPYEDDSQPYDETIKDEEETKNDVPTYDPYLNAEVLLPINGERKTAKVKFRKRDSEGNVIGKAAEHPILDTRLYVVEFPDGQEAEFAANTIAENMIAMCDEDGNQFLLAKSIVDHRKNDQALSEKDSYTTVNGRKTRRKTTKGWDFCVEMNDGTLQWLPLSLVKEQVPVEIAEYVVANDLQDEPAFAWWVPFTLKKRDTIINAVNKRYWKRTHKFGIRVPKSVEEALAIDKEAGNTRWADSIQKEMNNVIVAFKFLEDGETPPPGYQKMDCHLVFDVKMDAMFTYKSRMVAGGHVTDVPATLTYASVVSRESVRIALTMAALHDVEVKAADIQNAYLTAPCSEKIYTVVGPEFGENAGKTAIISRALYGLRSSAASYRNHISDCMRHLGWVPCKADADVWMKAEVRPDGMEYYAYALIYVDDILVIHHDGMKALKDINYYFTMKPSSMGDPDLYLGCKLRKRIMPNGVEAWTQSPSKYIREAVRNAKAHYEKRYDKPFPKKATSPFQQDYRPEMDTSAELSAEDVNYYQSQIGVLRWIVELGRIDIITEVSMLASQLALPREGHLEMVYRVFAFLGKRHNGMLAFDPTYPTVDMTQFNDGADWKNFYGDVKEMVPPDAPKPRGKEVVVRLFVDSDHAADQKHRRSRTGYLLYINMAPILFYSKKQGTVETSVFGAESVAMKIGIEASRGLRYKLRMMGIEVNEPTYVYGDNMSVIHNTQKPESTLKKKSNAICYHFIRESVAMGESLTAHIRSEDNPADICTKIMMGGMKRDRLTGMILYYATDEEADEQDEEARKKLAKG